MVGIYTWLGFKYPFEEIIKYIKNAGFQSVITWWGDDFREVYGPKESEPDIIRKYGLIIENTHFPFDDSNDIWVDSQNGQELLKKYLSYIDDCKTYEIPAAVVHVSNGDNPPPYGQLGLDRFKQLTEKAEKNNVTIALENLHRPDYLDFVFDSIESDKLKFCYDCGHENCFTHGINYLEKYGDKLAALHLHDNNGSRDEHLLPFKGTVNWKYIMGQLNAIDYKGPITLEVDAQFIDITKEYTVEEFLSEAFKRANKLAGMHLHPENQATATL